MPMVRISLRSGHNRAYKSILSNIIQSSLTTCFAAPIDDCFQLFDEYDIDNRVINSTYLSPGRSDDYILIEVTAGRPRNSQQKQQFYQMLAQQCQQLLGLAPADLMIIVGFNQVEDWSFSQGNMINRESL